MLVAVANVSLVIPVVSINVRTPSIRTWRCWLFAAWFSLLLVDAMTLRQLFDSIQSCRNGANVDSWVAHFFLISAAVICAILLNIRFLYLYGIFACFTCNGKRVLRTKKGLVQIYYNQSRTRQRDVRERKESQTDRDPLLHSEFNHHFLNTFVWYSDSTSCSASLQYNEFLGPCVVWI